MSSGPQVPLWIPLLVAGIGLLGVLITQVLAIWQEKQRADRRAQETEDERSHETRAWLRQERLALYGEFTTLAARGSRALSEIGRHSFEPKSLKASTDALESLRSTLQTFEEATGRIQIVGSYHVATLTLRVEQVIRKAYTFLMECVVTITSVEEWESKHDPLGDEYSAAHSDLLDAMRAELGIPAG